MKVFCFECGVDIENKYYLKHCKRKHPDKIPDRGYQCTHDKLKINCKICHKPITKPNYARHLKTFHNS